MAHTSRTDGTSKVSIVIDCDDCAVRGPGCRDCVVSVLLGVPQTLLQDERAALEVLADAGRCHGCGWCRSGVITGRGLLREMPEFLPNS